MKNFKLFILIILICSFQLSVKAQFNIKDKIKERVNRKTEEVIDKSLDKSEEKIEKDIENSDVKEDKKENTSPNEPVNGTNENKPENSEKPVNQTSDKKIEPKLESYTQYDFVPGDKIILFENFEQDAIGDFPALWTGNGTGEIKTTNLFQGKWFQLLASGMFACMQKDIIFPENFILEFDVIPTPIEGEENTAGTFYLSLFKAKEDNNYLDDGIYPGTDGVNIESVNNGWAVRGYKDGAAQVLDGGSEINPLEKDKVNHVIVWIQKTRLRIYFKGRKCVDLPSIIYPNIKFNSFRISNWGCTGLPYFSNIRFTTAAPDLRSKLLTEGKIISYGIYFDSGSDKLKAESYGSIKQIADILKENPTVKVKIIGHTDSDGETTPNLELSKRRALAVKESLTKNFSIDTGRLETDGKGENEPIDKANTAEAKAKNRRVEFIKL